MKKRYDLNYVQPPMLSRLKSFFSKQKPIKFLNIHINSTTNNSWIQRLESSKQLYRYKVAETDTSTT